MKMLPGAHSESATQPPAAMEEGRDAHQSYGVDSGWEQARSRDSASESAPGGRWVAGGDARELSRPREP